jgi:hypothetical protein
MATTKPIELTLSVSLTEERIQDLFESNDIKFSTAKAKKLKKILDDVYSDIQDIVEQSFEEAIDELIVEEWGE